MLENHKRRSAAAREAGKCCRIPRAPHSCWQHKAEISGGR
jgi:hypothetical protein